MSRTVGNYTRKTVTHSDRVDRIDLENIAEGEEVLEMIEEELVRGEEEAGVSASEETEVEEAEEVPVTGRRSRNDAAMMARRHQLAAEASTIISQVTEEHLTSYRHRYHIPASIDLEVPQAADVINGTEDGRIAIFKEYFDCGFRLPVHNFHQELLSYYQIGLGQLTPNSIRLVYGFILLCREEVITPTCDLFRCFYQLKVSGPEPLWYAFSRRSGAPALITATPSSIHSWKNFWFVVKAEQVGVSAIWKAVEQVSDRLGRRRAATDAETRLRNRATVMDGRAVLSEEVLKWGGIGSLPENVAIGDATSLFVRPGQSSRKRPATSSSAPRASTSGSAPRATSSASASRPVTPAFEPPASVVPAGTTSGVTPDVPEVDVGAPASSSLLRRGSKRQASDDSGSDVQVLRSKTSAKKKKKKTAQPPAQEGKSASPFPRARLIHSSEPMNGDDMPLAEVAARLKKAEDVAFRAKESIDYLYEELKGTTGICRRRMIFLDRQLDRLEGEQDELGLGTQEARAEALNAKEALSKQGEELQILRSKLDAEILRREKVEQERAVALSQIDAAIHAKDVAERAKERAQEAHVMAVSELEMERSSRAALASEGFTRGFNAGRAEAIDEAIALYKATDFEGEVADRIAAYKKSSEMGGFIREAMAEARNMGVTEATVALDKCQEDLPSDLQDQWDPTSKTRVLEVIEKFGVDVYAGLGGEDDDAEPEAEAVGSGEPDRVIVEDDEETSPVVTPGAGNGEEGSGDHGPL